MTRFAGAHHQSRRAHHLERWRRLDEPVDSWSLHRVWSGADSVVPNSNRVTLNLYEEVVLADRTPGFIEPSPGWKKRVSDSLSAIRFDR